MTRKMGVVQKALFGRDRALPVVPRNAGSDSPRVHQVTHHVELSPHQHSAVSHVRVVPEVVCNGQCTMQCVTEVYHFMCN